MYDGNHQRISTHGTLVTRRNIRLTSPFGKEPTVSPAPTDRISERIEKLPRDVGWMLFGVGFAGFVAPGIFGLPFMVAGGLILWPKTTNRLQSLLIRRSPQKTMAPGMKQIIRFLDDLERRYPPIDKP